MAIFSRSHTPILRGFWLALFLACVQGITGVTEAQTTPESFADLAEDLLPAVVNVSTTQTIAAREEGLRPPLPDLPPGSPLDDFFDEFFDNHPGFNNRGPRRSSSLGSGFIIDEAGYVVTNYHVVQGADEITIILQDDTNLAAELIGWDDKTDLAVLKVDSPNPLPALQWGDSNEVRVGDWVIAIGNPFGLGGTVTSGIISARARDINSGPYDDFLQTDAAINRGNSGGPMFNMTGEVIGINTAIFSPSGASVGIGFAIPSALARNVVDQLIEFGQTRRGWLGVKIQTVTPEFAENLGLDEQKGALVASVTPGGPAEEAGLATYDVILEFDGKEIEEMRDLPRIVAETEVGSEVEVVVWRDGQREEFAVMLGQLEVAEEQGLLDLSASDPSTDPPTRNTEQEFPELGMTLAPVTEALRERMGIIATRGLVVVGTAGDGSAAIFGIKVGDVILEVNQTPVNHPDEMAEILQSSEGESTRSLLLLVDSQGEKWAVAIMTTRD